MSRGLLGVLFTLPAIVLLALFAWWPFVMAIRLSFYEHNGLGLHEFVGLGNFRAILADSLFWHSVGVLLIFAVLLVPLQTAGPLVGAKLLHSVRNARAAFLYRVVFVLPLVIPMVVGVLIWRNIYGMDGALNRVLELIGLGAQARVWLGETQTVIPAIVFMGVPFIGGVNLLIYLAGLINIPESLYEAAAIEGAGRWRTFWSVELPLLRPQIKLILVLSIIGSVQAYEHILILTNGGPANATLVPALYLFKNGFEFGQLGYASAVGAILFAVTLGLTLLNMRLLRSDD